MAMDRRSPPDPASRRPLRHRRDGQGLAAGRTKDPAGAAADAGPGGGLQYRVPARHRRQPRSGQRGGLDRRLPRLRAAAGERRVLRLPATGPRPCSRRGSRASRETLAFTIRALLARGHAGACVLNADSPTLPPRCSSRRPSGSPRRGSASCSAPRTTAAIILLGMTRLHPRPLRGHRLEHRHRRAPDARARRRARARGAPPARMVRRRRCRLAGAAARRAFRGRAVFARAWLGAGAAHAGAAGRP